jgi:hypothetical protein
MGPDLKGMEMPPAPAGAEGAEEEFDFGEEFESEGEEEMGESPDLAEVSDEDLIKEMEARGFEVEDVPEETGEVVDEEAEEPIL